MAQIEKIGDKKKPVAKRPPAQAPPQRAAQRPRPPRPAPAQEELPAAEEESLTAEQWAEKLKQEEAEKARQEEDIARSRALAKEAAEKKAAQQKAKPKLMTKEEFLASQQAGGLQEDELTKEQWAARLAEEQKPKKITREEFLAMQAQKPASAPPKAPPKRRSFFLDRLAANADSALGVKPQPQPAQPAALQEVGAAQETGGVQEVSSATGIFDNMRESPIIAGAVTVIGLVMVLIGIHLTDISALIDGGIGFILILIGGIFLFGHVKIMLHR